MKALVRRDENTCKLNIEYRNTCQYDEACLDKHIFGMGPFIPYFVIKSMRKSEHISKIPHIGHLCTNNIRGWCNYLGLKYGYMNVCLQLEGCAAILYISG